MSAKLWTEARASRRRDAQLAQGALQLRGGLGEVVNGMKVIPRAVDAIRAGCPGAQTLGRLHLRLGAVEDAEPARAAAQPRGKYVGERAAQPVSIERELG